MPWDYVGDNTIFQVIHHAGLRTAWSTTRRLHVVQRPRFESGAEHRRLLRPGNRILQAVEPNGVPYPQDNDWAHIDAATKQYDGYKVQPLRRIDGLYSGKSKVGTPGDPRHELPHVSVAEKIPSTPTTLIGPDKNGNYTTSAPQAGGYQFVNGKSSRVRSCRALLITPTLSWPGWLPSIEHDLSRRQSSSRPSMANRRQNPKELVTIQDCTIITAIILGGDPQQHQAVAGTDDDVWELSDNSQAPPTTSSRPTCGTTVPGTDAST